jgi:hypothetical protein
MRREPLTLVSSRQGRTVMIRRRPLEPSHDATCITGWARRQRRQARIGLLPLVTALIATYLLIGCGTIQQVPYLEPPVFIHADNQFQLQLAAPPALQTADSVVWILRVTNRSEHSVFIADRTDLDCRVGALELVFGVGSSAIDHDEHLRELPPGAWRDLMVSYDDRVNPAPCVGTRTRDDYEVRQRAGQSVIRGRLHYYLQDDLTKAQSFRYRGGVAIVRSRELRFLGRKVEWAAGHYSRREGGWWERGSISCPNRN